MKHFIKLCLFLILFLTACGGAALPEEGEETSPEATEAVAQATDASESPTAESEATEVVEPSPTPIESEDISMAGDLPTAEPTEDTATEDTATNDEADADASNDEASASPAECYEDPINQAIDMEQKADLPAITDRDWQHGGGEDATITVIEYGDFQ